MIMYHITGRAKAILSNIVPKGIFYDNAILLISGNQISVYSVVDGSKTLRNVGIEAQIFNDLTLSHEWSYDFEWNNEISPLASKEVIKRKVNLSNFHDTNEATTLCYVLKGLYESVNGRGQLTSKTCNQGLLDLGMKPIAKWHVNYLTHGISFEDSKANGEKTDLESIRIEKAN